MASHWLHVKVVWWQGLLEWHFRDIFSAQFLKSQVQGWLERASGWGVYFQTFCFEILPIRISLRVMNDAGEPNPLLIKCWTWPNLLSSCRRFFKEVHTQQRLTNCNCEYLSSELVCRSTIGDQLAKIQFVLLKYLPYYCVRRYKQLKYLN